MVSGWSCSLFKYNVENEFCICPQNRRRNKSFNTLYVDDMLKLLSGSDVRRSVTTGDHSALVGAGH